jgi:P27 family predicted phage terminase small subunit
MGIRGRKPKSAITHIINGNPGKRPINEHEPVADGALGEPPPDLTPDQLKLWAYAIQHAPAHVLRLIDRDVLRAWVIAGDLHRKAAAIIEAEGLISTGAEGQPMRHPAIAVLRDATSMMMRAAEQMGFSPTARARIKAPGPKTIDKKNPFAALKGNAANS